MRTTAKIYALNAALIVGLFVASAAAWDALPSEIPHHFGLSGRADAWSTKEGLSWFALPITAAASGVGMYLLSLLARRRPTLYNVPRKDEFLALRGDRRSPVIEMLEAFLACVAVTVTVHMAAAQYAIYAAAVSGTDRLSLVTVLTLIGGTIALVVGGALFMQRVDERIRQLSSEDARDAP